MNEEFVEPDIPQDHGVALWNMIRAYGSSCACDPNLWNRVKAMEEVARQMRAAFGAGPWDSQLNGLTGKKDG